MTREDRRPSKNLLKRIRSLQSKKGRVESGCFLAEGPKVVGEAERAGLDIQTLFFAESFADTQEWEGLKKRVGLDGHFTLPDFEFAKISSTDSPQGILAEVRIPSDLLLDTLEPSPQPIIVLDAVQDPGNVGTAIRSAAALGGHAVLLAAGCADLWNPKTVRSSSGSTFHLPVLQGLTVEAVMEWVKRNRIRVLVATAEGESLHSLRPSSEPIALVFGNESKGPDPRWFGLPNAQGVGLPMERGIDSLNVGVTAAIFLAIFREKRIS